jgi:acetyl esterase/lipase
VAGQQSPIIIYLPTGPAAADSSLIKADDGEIVTALSAATNAYVVRVNYRLGDGVHYPTPIHDVLTGYDWVKKNMSPSGTASSRYPLRVGVCGQLIGGSLATMLALTESRMGESCIAAAAVNAPIVDWMFPEPEPGFVASEIESDRRSGGSDEADSSGFASILKSKTKKKPKKASSWELYHHDATLPASSLLNVRNTIFRKPANYFDSFASPILFFRSPGVDVPLPVLDIPSDEELIEQTPSIRRKVHRAFPPTGSSLRIPDMRISIGIQSPLYDQGEELVLLLRRSIMRSHHKSSSRQPYDRFDEASQDEDAVTQRALAEAERRVEFHVNSDTGLWGCESEPNSRTNVIEAGAWLRKVLN